MKSKCLAVRITQRRWDGTCLKELAALKENHRWCLRYEIHQVTNTSGRVNENDWLVSLSLSSQSPAMLQSSLWNVSLEGVPQCITLQWLWPKLTKLHVLELAPAGAKEHVFLANVCSSTQAFTPPGDSRLIDCLLSSLCWTPGNSSPLLPQSFFCL